MTGEEKTKVNSCSAQCFACALQLYCKSRQSSRFLCFELVSRGSGMHGESERAGLFDLILSNRRSSWAGRDVPEANPNQSRERTGIVSACLIHVRWNSYCTPGGNVLKRSSRLKKRRTHVFCGLQGNWKSHAALPDYYRKTNYALIEMGNVLNQ